MIRRFNGEYRFLSNFWYVKVEMYGLMYPSVEHAYQAAKTLNKEQREQIRRLRTPAQAKRMGRRVQVRDDWETFKLFAMKELLRRKFDPTTHPELAQMLLDTGNQRLCEENWWHDTFWGVCTCPTHNITGQNHLGRMLVQVRTEIRDSKEDS